MFGKKGDLITIHLFELVMGILVFIMFFQATAVIDNEYALQRYFVAKDVSFLIDAAQAIPQNIYYEYPESVLSTNIHIIKNQVIVGPATKEGISSEEAVETSYFFSKNKFITVNDAVVPGLFFVMEKQGNIISFFNTSNRAVSKKLFIKQKKAQLKLAVITPELTNSENNDFLKRIARAVEGSLSSKYFVFDTQPNMKIGISFGEKNIIYYSHLGEMKELSIALKKRLEFKDYTFNLLQGNRFLVGGTPSIEIILDDKFQKQIASNINDFSLGVRQVFETFYAK